VLMLRKRVAFHDFEVHERAVLRYQVLYHSEGRSLERERRNEAVVSRCLRDQLAFHPATGSWGIQ